jgi:hypothetical protein
MLDGMKLEEIEQQLGLPVKAVDFNSFSALIAGASFVNRGAPVRSTLAAAKSSA